MSGKRKLEYTMENIQWLNRIAGRGLSECSNAIKNTDGNTVDAINYLIKRGEPAVGFNPGSDMERRHKEGYPNKDEIINRILDECDGITMNEYHKTAKKTSIVPENTDRISYFTMALCGEAGEIANKVKKIIRDKNNEYSSKDISDILGELGDCLWYISNFAEELGSSLSAIAETNLTKVKRRYHDVYYSAAKNLDTDGTFEEK